MKDSGRGKRLIIQIQFSSRLVHFRLYSSSDSQIIIQGRGEQRKQKFPNEKEEHGTWPGREKDRVRDKEGGREERK